MQENTNTTKGKRELTPLEREIRNKAIRDWAAYGLTVTSIKSILSEAPHASTISRVIDKTDNE